MSLSHVCCSIQCVLPTRAVVVRYHGLIQGSYSTALQTRVLAHHKHHAQMDSTFVNCLVSLALCVIEARNEVFEQQPVIAFLCHPSNLRSRSQRQLFSHSVIVSSND